MDHIVKRAQKGGGAYGPSLAWALGVKGGGAYRDMVIGLQKCSSGGLRGARQLPSGPATSWVQQTGVYHNSGSDGLDIPYPPDEDVRQAQRDRRDEQIRQALNWHLIRQDVLERLALAWLEGEGRLGVIVDQLTDAPIRDRFDLEGYLRHCGARDAKGLGLQVMRLVAETVLAHVEGVDHDTPF